ncbi:MAG: GNAT family N-acetyltransferase [Crocinitomicaceae bacterium]
MKNKSNLINQNIQNLTSLWQEASLFSNSFIRSPLFNYTAIEDMNWPNRLWFNKDLDQETILLVKNKILSDFPNLIIPYWDIYDSNSNQLLEQNGFIKLFEQIGMSLELHNSFEVQTGLKIVVVSTKDEAVTWSKLFTSSFGYEIHPNIITNTNKTINYHIAFQHDKAIGTAITYQTNKVIGIHAMGIVPEARRNGYADQLMKLLINQSLKNDIEHIVLQASNIGLDLYKKIGFKEQFKIQNYRFT